MSKPLKGGFKEDRARLFSLLLSGSGHKQKRRRFCLKVRNGLFFFFYYEGSRAVMKRLWRLHAV